MYFADAAELGPYSTPGQLPVVAFLYLQQEGRQLGLVAIAVEGLEFDRPEHRVNVGFRQGIADGVAILGDIAAQFNA